MREQLPNIYNHFIARDIQAYFRLAMGERRKQDFLQVMNRPKRYIGRDSLSGSEVSFEDIRKHYCDKAVSYTHLVRLRHCIYMLPGQRICVLYFPAWRQELRKSRKLIRLLSLIHI